MTKSRSPDDHVGPLDLQPLLSGTGNLVGWPNPVIWVVGIVAFVLLVGGYLWQVRGKSSVEPVFVTETLGKGNITLTVSANGTLQPTRSVNIGSELSGTVLRVLADVNDHVKRRQVLVELDTSKLRDQVARSKAALNSAIARVALAHATAQEAAGNLNRLEEVARLSGGKVPSKAEFAAGQAAVARAQADEASAQAEVVAARAAVTTDETNLSKGSIRSPIDGVVLSRTVEPGNAVAASLQAVTLFTLAEDLSKLKLQVNVDEADVGSVQVGQKSNFTVSAYPSRKYPAVVNRVAFGSTITENVVTYVTYLDVDNSDLSLRPGMTASATIYAIEHHDAILVPNTALRFTPTRGIGGSKPSDGLVSSLLPRMPRSGPVKSTSTTGPARRVWVLRDGKAVDIPITTGISDGRMTEVTVGELESGMLVITDQRNAGSSP